MKLEKQQVSLDIAKELKEAGYPQEGLWWWVYGKHQRKWFISIGIHTSKKEERYVAPTVAELGEVLPSYFGSCSLISTIGERIFKCVITPKSREFKQITANTEADSRAKMWLYLKKEEI